MGLGKLFPRPERPVAHERAAGAGFQVVIDGVNANWPMTAYRGGMSIPAAWRAALLLSDMLGSVPWQAKRKRAGKPLETIEPTPWLLEQPAPPDTQMTTFSSWALDLIWHGNAIAVVADRDANGYPTACYPVPADWVGVRRKVGPDYALSQLPAGPIEYSVGGKTYSRHEIIHIKGPCAPGALRGFGVLEAHMNGTLATVQEQERQVSNLAINGVPTGVLKTTNPDATPAAMRATKAAFVQQQRDRTIAMLNATTEFEPIAWNPEQMQMVEARKFSDIQIANIFGIPTSFVGADQASKVYSNVEQEGISLLRYSLRGHLARFEQTLSLCFPRGTRVEADLTEVLRADTLTRYQAYAIALDKKFATPDEIRNKEGDPPLTAAQKAELTPPVPEPAVEQEPNGPALKAVPKGQTA